MPSRSARAKADKRPWGEWRTLLEDSAYKVKRITVKPGHRLSYQTHAQRQEHWTVARGRALVTLDGRDLRLAAGQCALIPKGSAHRVRNPGKEDLVLIEVQTGEYFGEDDITRLDDDYGRTRKERT